MFFIWRFLRPFTAASSLGPSTPWFHERLSAWPSRLPSPFASLCFSLSLTRSLSVKPSCAVTKLTLAQGWRPRWSKTSGEPHSRGASAAALPSPRQKSHTLSRKRSFHSAQPGGKRPSW